MKGRGRRAEEGDNKDEGQLTLAVASTRAVSLTGVRVERSIL